MNTKTNTKLHILWSYVIKIEINNAKYMCKLLFKTQMIENNEEVIQSIHVNIDNENVNVHTLVDINYIINNPSPIVQCALLTDVKDLVFFTLFCIFSPYLPLIIVLPITFIFAYLLAAMVWFLIMEIYEHYYEKTHCYNKYHEYYYYVGC